MLSPPSGTQVFLCTSPIDCRKSFDGLCAAVELVFQRDVFAGHLFLFLNKRRDRLKALWWDDGGLAIFYKRLEVGCFELPRDAEQRGHVTLDATALAMLLGGVPLATPRRPRYSRPSAASAASTSSV
jgi:transposase